MIDTIEISPSNRAKCKSCNEKIVKGEPRGTEYYSNGQYDGTTYYCYKCTEKKLDEAILEIKTLKKIHKKMCKKQSKILILKNL